MISVTSDYMPTKKNSLALLLCILFILTNVQEMDAGCIKHVIKDTICRNVDGHEFVMIWEIVDGAVIETRLIDNASVSESVYENALCEAEKAERMRQVEHERIEAQKKATDMRLIQKKAAQKLIEIALDRVRAELKHIDEYSLEPHLLWNAKTVASHEEYEKCVAKNIPEAEKLLHLPSDVADTESLDRIKSCATELEEYAQRLSSLFLESVNHVIAHTHDTKLLKRLMELV